MTPVLIVTVIAVFVALIIGLWLLTTYNGFVRIRNLVQEAWKQIDVELQRRHDLIPNLIETASAAAQFERDTLQQVTAARNVARDAAATHQGVAAQSQAEQQLSGALGRFFAVAESYPQLQSIQNFVALQRELANTEDRIAAVGVSTTAMCAPSTPRCRRCRPTSSRGGSGSPKPSTSSSMTRRRGMCPPFAEPSTA